MQLRIEGVFQRAFKTSLILAFDNSNFLFHYTYSATESLLRNKLSGISLVIKIGGGLKTQGKAFRRAKH